MCDSREHRNRASSSKKYSKHHDKLQDYVFPDKDKDLDPWSYY
jgi:hypothetical protein